jgi:hypothetical protein
MPETVVHFQIRMPPALHERLASMARGDKKSLNALVVGLLEEATARQDGGTPPSHNGPAKPKPH